MLWGAGDKPLSSGSPQRGSPGPEAAGSPGRGRVRASVPRPRRGQQAALWGSLPARPVPQTRGSGTVTPRQVPPPPPASHSRRTAARPAPPRRRTAAPPRSLQPLGPGGLLPPAAGNARPSGGAVTQAEHRLPPGGGRRNRAAAPGSSLTVARSWGCAGARPPTAPAAPPPGFPSALSAILRARDATGSGVTARKEPPPPPPSAAPRRVASRARPRRGPGCTAHAPLRRVLPGRGAAGAAAARAPRPAGGGGRRACGARSVAP